MPDIEKMDWDYALLYANKIKPTLDWILATGHSEYQGEPVRRVTMRPGLFPDYALPTNAYMVEGKAPWKPLVVRIIIPTQGRRILVLARPAGVAKIIFRDDLPQCGSLVRELIEARSSLAA